MKSRNIMKFLDFKTFFSLQLKPKKLIDYNKELFFINNNDNKNIVVKSNLNDYIKNKTILFLSPYPCKLLF